jgi:sec-independent protein translocase protein TatA
MVPPEILLRTSLGGVMFEGLFQPMHLLILLVIVLLIFGPSKLADLGKGLGDGIRGFKQAVKDDPATEKK